MLDTPVTSQYLWKRICICQQCLSHAVLHISIMKQEITLESDLGFFHQRLKLNSLVSVTVDGTKVSWIFYILYTILARYFSWLCPAVFMSESAPELALPWSQHMLCLSAGFSREAPVWVTHLNCISDLKYYTLFWFYSVPYPHCFCEAWYAVGVPLTLPFPVHTPSCRTQLCGWWIPLMHKQCFTAIRLHTNTALGGDGDFPHSLWHFNSTWSQLRPLCTFAALALSCLDWSTINSKVLYVF